MSVETLNSCSEQIICGGSLSCSTSNNNSVLITASDVNGDIISDRAGNNGFKIFPFYYKFPNQSTPPTMPVIATISLPLSTAIYIELIINAYSDNIPGGPICPRYMLISFQNINGTISAGMAVQNLISTFIGNFSMNSLVNLSYNAVNGTPANNYLGYVSILPGTSSASIVNYNCYISGVMRIYQ